MSVQHATQRERGETEGTIAVSLHARLRYMERVDPREAFPAARIREIYENGEEYQNTHRRISNARRLGDVVVGYSPTQRVITTVILVDEVGE